MKKLLFTILLAAPALVYAQDQNPCQDVELTCDDKTIVLKSNVKIEAGDVTMEADSAFFYNANQTWVAYGVKGVIVNDSKAVAQKKRNNIVCYKLKDKTICLE